jgi:hypothetical protein
VHYDDLFQLNSLYIHFNFSNRPEHVRLEWCAIVHDTLARLSSRWANAMHWAWGVSKFHYCLVTDTIITIILCFKVFFLSFYCKNIVMGYINQYYAHRQLIRIMLHYLNTIYVHFGVICIYYEACIHVLISFYLLVF